MLSVIKSYPFSAQANRHGIGAIYHASRSDDGNRIVSAGCDGKIKLWELPSAEDLRARVEPAGMKHKGTITKLSTTANGRIVTLAEDMTIKVWDAKTGKCMLSIDEIFGLWGRVETFDVTSDGRWIICHQNSSYIKDKNGTAKIFDGFTGSLLMEVLGLSRHSEVLQFSPNARMFLDGDALWSCSHITAGNLADFTSADVASKKVQPIRAMTLPEVTVNCSAATFSPDNKKILYGDCDRRHIFFVWDIAAACIADVGTSVNCHFSLARIQQLSYCRDQSFFVVVSSTAFEVWDAAQMVCLDISTAHGGGINKVEFSCKSGSQLVR